MKYKIVFYHFFNNEWTYDEYTSSNSGLDYYEAVQMAFKLNKDKSFKAVEIKEMM